MKRSPEAWQHVAGWHGDLVGTKGIGSKSDQKIDVDSSPTLRAYYDHHLPFYEKLREFKLSVGGLNANKGLAVIAGQTVSALIETSVGQR